MGCVGILGTDVQLPTRDGKANPWNHPFWVVDKKAWIEVKDLKVGDRVLLSSGKEVAISGIRSYNVEATKVYNFEVADNHTYFVGEDGVLVHNYDGTAAATYMALKLGEWIAQNPEEATEIAYETAKELAAPPCDKGEVCAVFPGIGLVNKVTGKALTKLLGREVTEDLSKARLPERILSGSRKGQIDPNAMGQKGVNFVKKVEGGSFSPEKIGNRNVDLYDRISGRAIEVKNSFSKPVSLDKRIREEIEKDVRLRSLSPGSYKPEWHFVGQPPTRGLQKLLSDKGIRIVIYE